MWGGSDKNITRTYTTLVPTFILVYQNASHISKDYPKVEGSHGFSFVDYFFVSIIKGNGIVRSVVLSLDFPHYVGVAARRDQTATHPIAQQDHSALGVAAPSWLHTW